MLNTDIYLSKDAKVFSEEDSGLTPVNARLLSFFGPTTSRRSDSSTDPSPEPEPSPTPTEQISHSDLVNIKPDDHHTRYTDSEAITAVNNNLSHGSDAIHKPSDLRQEGASNGQAIVWNDSTSQYEPTDVALGSSYTDEDAQDAVGNILSTDESDEIVFDYNDSENKISARGGVIDFGGF